MFSRILNSRNIDSFSIKIITKTTSLKNQLSSPPLHFVQLFFYIYVQYTQSRGLFRSTPKSSYKSRIGKSFWSPWPLCDKQSDVAPMSSSFYHLQKPLPEKRTDFYHARRSDLSSLTILPHSSEVLNMVEWCGHYLYACTKHSRFLLQTFFLIYAFCSCSIEQTQFLIHSDLMFFHRIIDSPCTLYRIWKVSSIKSKLSS